MRFGAERKNLGRARRPARQGRPSVEARLFHFVTHAQRTSRTPARLALDSSPGERRSLSARRYLDPLGAAHTPTAFSGGCSSPSLRFGTHACSGLLPDLHCSLLYIGSICWGLGCFASWTADRRGTTVGSGSGSSLWALSRALSCQPHPALCPPLPPHSWLHTHLARPSFSPLNLAALVRFAAPLLSLSLPPSPCTPCHPTPAGPFLLSSSRAPPWCCTSPVARPPRATHSRLRLVPRPGDLHGTSASPPLYDASLACSAPSLQSAGWHPRPLILTRSSLRLTFTTSTTTTTTPAALASTNWHRLRRSHLTVSSTPPPWSSPRSYLLRLPTAIAHRLAQAHSDIDHPGKITAVYAIISLSFPSLRHRPVSLSK